MSRNKRVARGGGGTIRPAIPAYDASWTLYDPNAIVQSVAAGSPDGWSVRLQAAGASKNAPNTGAVWSRAGLRNVLGTSLSSYNPMEHMTKIMLMERDIPATTPNLMVYGMGFADNADPTLATSGVVACLTYPSTDVRRVAFWRCTALNTWSITEGTTGQNDCFGAVLELNSKSALGVTDVNELPLDSTGFIKVIGTNTARSTATLTASTWTHTYVFAGWYATGGTNGDTIRFAPKYWVCPLTGRG